MATTRAAPGVQYGVTLPREGDIGQTIAPGRRTLVGDEVGASAQPSVTPKLETVESKELVEDLDRALGATRGVREHLDSVRASASSPEPWRYALIAATLGPTVLEGVLATRLAGADDAVVHGVGVSSVEATEALLEAFLDDLRRRVEGLQAMAATVARSGVDVRPAMTPALVAIRERFDAIGGVPAVITFAARANAVVTSADVTPGPVTRAVELASDHPLGFSQPAMNENQFYGGIAVGAAKGIAGAISDTFNGLELAGELTAAMIAALLEGRAIEAIVTAAGQLADAINSHPFDKFEAALAL